MKPANRLTIALILSALPLRAQDELTILSPHWEGIRLEFGDAFKKLYRQEVGREVDLKWLDVGGASDILKYLKSEFKNKPDGIGVDLFFGGGTDPYEELKRLGLLEPCRLPEEALRELAPDIGGVPLYDKDFTWYAATMAGFGIIYNKIVLERLGLPEPKTWEDLARPELRTWVGSGDPRKSGSVHMAYEIILQGYGWERGWPLITAMGANVRGFSSHGSQTAKDVALGEVAYGLAIDSFAWAQVREAGEDKIGFVLPQDLTVVNGDAIAILKGAPHRNVAERFIRFVLSEPGQKLWILNKGEADGPQKFEIGKLSVVPGLYPKVAGRTSVKINPFEWHSSFTYDSELGSARWAIYNDLLGTQVIDPHKALSACWRKAIQAGTHEAALRQLAALPVSEEGALRLAKAQWKDAEFRNRALMEWAAFARKKYEDGGARTGLLANLPGLLALSVFIFMVVYLKRRKAA